MKVGAAMVHGLSLPDFLIVLAPKILCILVVVAVVVWLAKGLRR